MNEELLEKIYSNTTGCVVLLGLIFLLVGIICMIVFFDAKEKEDREKEMRIEKRLRKEIEIEMNKNEKGVKNV